MVAYSFKKQFPELILAGTKGGTIRADRKRHARPGEELQLYTGMRTKHCRLIARRMCLSVERIMLDFRGSGCVVFKDRHAGLRDRLSLDCFARFDGFNDWSGLCAFWKDERDRNDRRKRRYEHLPIFHGVHIRWLDWPKELAA